MLHVRASRLRLQCGPLLLLAAICLLAASCGDSKHGKLLSTKQASELRGTLSQVQQDIAASNCTGAEQQVAALQDQIDGIKRLDRNLRSALRSSTRRLETLVSDKCEATTTTPTQTTPTTPDEGTTGATGATGDEGKKPKKEKPPKKTPPGQDEKGAPGEQGGGGGAGLPGESNFNENGGD
jgi:TolA-binding protein